MSELSAEDRKDIQLMLAVQTGDLQAYEMLFKKYEKPIYNFFISLGSGRTHAEDLMQETFLRLWKSCSHYNPQGKFSTYLFQIAKNAFLSFIAKKKRLRETSFAADTDNAGQEYSFEAKTASPEQSLEQAETAAIIQKAIDKLDEKHRLVFVLAHYQDLKYAEISEVLDIPVGTVKTRMMHAEKKLREILKPFFTKDEKDNTS